MGREVTRLAGVDNYAPGQHRYWYRFNDTGETFWHHNPNLTEYSRDVIQVVNHSTACIMDGMPDCSCPASSVRIIL